MGVIRSGDENHIEFLCVLFEDFPPIRISGRSFPAFLAVDTVPPVFVDLGKGDTLKASAVGCACMASTSSAHCDETDLEFFV
jgi:hypothetical protein